MQKVKYDTIGKGYNQTRQADPYLLERMYSLLAPKSGNLYLDIGCGTGNYTTQLHSKGVDFVGVDPSEHMLEIAQSKNNAIRWVKGRVEDLPLENEYFDGVLGSLTIHHWTNKALGFKELNRVLKKEGTFVLFTSTPKQMDGYWLNHYFPKMLKDSMIQMPSFETIEKHLLENGFHHIQREPYFIQEDLQDLFLYSGKHQPERYFMPHVRQGISSFSSLANRTEVETGLIKLKADISSGKIQEIIQNYQNEDGDYLFIKAQKV